MVKNSKKKKQIDLILKGILYATPISLTAILYFLTYERSNMLSFNLYNFLLVSICLILSIYFRQNENKVVALSNIIMISIWTSIINVKEYGVVFSKQLFVDYMSSWCGLWLLFGLLAIMYLVILLVRKIDLKILKAELISNENVVTVEKICDYRDKLKDIDGEEKNYDTAKLDEKRSERKQEEFEQKNKQEKFAHVGSIVLTIIILSIYFFLPISLLDYIEKWADNLNKFGLYEQKPLEGQIYISILTYTIYFIMVTGIIISAFIVLYQCIQTFIRKKVTSKNIYSSWSKFFDLYKIPIVVMIFGVAILITFSRENYTENILRNIGYATLIVNLIILILMVVLELLRLSLDQCTREKSLLRRVIRYIYILTVNCVMEIVMGILAEIDFRGWISSFISFFGIDSNNAVKKRIRAAMEKAVLEEILNIEGKQEKGKFQHFKRKVKSIRR
ncbi:MAG: hypothetical protein PUF12_10470 [Thermoflexaceae bacterium]|nr:hypothetical protein [Thermoflexaceae bacterium]